MSRGLMDVDVGWEEGDKVRDAGGREKGRGGSEDSRASRDRGDVGRKDADC